MKKLLCLLLIVLAGVMGVCAAPVALSEETVDLCPDLAVCGGMIWRVRNATLLCEDVEAGEILATMPLSELYEPGGAPFLSSVVAWTDDTALLILGVRDAANRRSIRLTELGLTEGAITAIKSHDASDALDFLSDDGAAWYEVNMVACGQRLFIAAMDDAYLFHFFLYTPDADALKPLGERSLAVYIAALPYGDGMLIVGPNESDGGLLELTRLSLEDGDTELMDSIRLDSALSVSNFAWDASQTLLYYTSNNTVWSLAPNAAEPPKVVGVLSEAPVDLHLGAVAGSRFVALSEDGRLISCDVNAPVALSAQLRIADIGGSGAVLEAARDFGIANPGCSVSVADAVEEAEALSAIDTHSPEYDAYVLPLNSGLYRAFRKAGFMADLSRDGTLSSAVADMTPRMAAAIQADGHLYAMPLAVGSSCQLLNVPAMEALTGLSRDQLPTDWPGFLALLGRLAEDGALSGGVDYRLLDVDLPAEGLRETLFSWMFQDCLLWVQANGGTDGLAGVMSPLLRAFDETDWSRLAADGNTALGQSDSMSGGVLFDPRDSEAEPLLSDGMLNIEVTPQAEGMALWPLSVQPGGERLIGQAASVICVNPWSNNLEAALSFAAHAWEKVDVQTRMALCQSMNTPTVNTAYEEDLKYMAEDVEMLRQAVVNAKSPDERAYLQAELDQLSAYMADYRKNARWLASRESIAQYRSHAEALVPTEPYFDLDDPVNEAMYRYLDGALTAEQLIDALAEATG